MNQPKRAAFGVNIRSMYRAPPGHVIISSDFEQLEARLYAARTKEPSVLLAINEGRDLHVWNYTGLMITDPVERLSEYERMIKARKEGTKAQKSDIEYRRLIAKIAWFGLCLAEGTLVLTQRGEVPIEQVEDCDLVWDGTEWVSHHGVVCRGEKEVIEHDGIEATPSHECWTEDGEKLPLQEIKAQGRRIARTGDGAAPLRYDPSGDRQGCQEGQTQDGRGRMPIVREGLVDLPVERGQGSGDHSAVRVARGLHPMGAREVAEHGLQRTAVRSDRQQRAILEGQPAPRDTEGEHGESRRVRVYDIMNAGPRRRFTANGRLVSNCYGMWPDTLYQYMWSFRDKASNVRKFTNIDEQQCRDMYERFHEMHPNCNIWHSQVDSFVRQHGYLPAFHGKRRRYFPGGPAKKNAPYNHDIQSSAAKLTNDACRAIADEIPFQKWSPYSGLSLQVHDELCAVVPESRAEEAVEIFDRLMEYDLDGIRIWAEAEIQRNWTIKVDR